MRGGQSEEEQEVGEEEKERRQGDGREKFVVVSMDIQKSFRL